MIGSADTRCAPSTAASPTPPQPKIATASPGRTAGTPGDAEHAGGDPASEQAAQRRIERGVDGQGAVGRHDGMGGEARDVGEVVHGLAVERQPARAVA